LEHLIERLYNHDEHKSSDKPNAISTTTLLGGLYRGKLALEKAPQDKSLIKMMYKRSSTLGTALHYWAEHVFENDENIVQELYREREVELDGVTYTISGSCDLLEKQADGSYTLADWKTFYGKERNAKALEKDRMQMSIYRWLLQDEYDINDTCYSLAISQSNNFQSAYPSEMMTLEQTQEYIEDRLYAIVSNGRVDCNEGIRYSACTYCTYANCDQRKD